MPYAVAEPCIDCKRTDCVEVCPVDCFPTCPVEAIYADDELPAKWEHYAEWNNYLSKQRAELGYNITKKKEPLPDAETWAEEPQLSQKSEADILTWEASA